MNDAELVRFARQGDPAAWEALVRAHQQAVFRLAYLCTGDPDEAEDVAQESFIRFYRAMDRFDPSRPVRPWLLRIARNLAYNQRRALGRYLNALQRWFAQEELVSRPGPEAQTRDQMAAEALWRTVRRLSPDDQSVIYLRYYLEMDVADTAETLGVAPGTVKSRLHRALARLRTLLETAPEAKEVFDESA